MKIAGIKRVMEKESFLRVLSEQERELFDRIPEERRTEWLAGRFAAKEAVVKAVHKEKSYILSAVEILADAAGAPTCYIAGLQMEISISHEREYAIVYTAAMEEQMFMYILRGLYPLWLIPRNWIDAVLMRKKPFVQRCACMKR